MAVPMERKKYEEFAWVLDHLPQGKPGAAGSTYRAEPLIQALGETFFTLLEAVVIRNAAFTAHERVYVGKEQPRGKIIHITGRIGYEDLTSTSRAELPAVIDEIVKSQEARFVEFFNISTPVTPRMHSLELLPGIGKKYLWSIISARDRKPFDSFDDVQKRANIPNPAKLVSRRILEELSAEQKYYIFTRPR